MGKPYIFYCSSIQLQLWPEITYSISKTGYANFNIQEQNDILSLSNDRPITLLNTDTKLIAYALAQRFKKVLPLIISNDQNGYINNRYIGFNIRQIILNTLTLTVQFFFLDLSKNFIFSKSYHILISC